MAVSPDTLAAQLAEAGLVPQAELAALREQHQPADAEALARLLVKQKVLTAYQAQQAYAGKSKALVLGNYVILDKLGQGGMGMVLKARHRRMNRIVALKVLSPAVTKTPDAMKRFQREVEAAAKLHHPHIVTAHDADEVNGTHFLVMEYVEGTDLSVLVKKKGPLPVDQVINCMLQAARGLEYAHRHGVIHRDIKPANLLLDKDGTIKVLDMGLARIEGETGANAELTSTGAVMGTVDYMAPEQALSTKSADARSDIYSLGISLWYLLIGRPVFEGDSLMARLIAHRETPPPSLKGARGEVPAALDVLFQKMIAKKPADRCQSMTEVIAVLETCRLPLAPSAKSTPSFTTGPSEESKLSEFMGLFGGGTDPNSPTRSVAAVGSSATVGAPPSGSEYDVTVTSATSRENTQTQGVRLATGASKPSKAGPRWLIAVIVVVSITALPFVVTMISTPTKRDLPTTSTATSLPDRKDATPSPSVLTEPLAPFSSNFALEFDGVDDYVDLTSNWEWNGKELTFEAWLVPPPRQDVVPPAVTLLALEQGDPATGSRARLMQTLYTPPKGEPKPQIHVSNPAHSEAFVSANTLVPERLTHVAVVWRGREAQLFIDGKSQERSTYNYAFKPRRGDPYLWLGALRADAPDGKPSSFWKGRLRQVRISSKALYVADFAPEAGLSASPETVALYRMEGGTGNVLTDSSGNNRHGRIHGATWNTLRSGASSSEQSPVVGDDIALEFDGLQSYVEVPAAGLDLGRPYTLEAWVASRRGKNTTLAILRRGPQVAHLIHGFSNPGWEAICTLDAGAPMMSSIKTLVPVPDLQLQHVAFVCDPVNKSGQVFLDGVPATGSISPAQIQIDNALDSPNLVIGCFLAGDLSRNGFLEGRLHEFRVSQSARYSERFQPARRFEPDAETVALFHVDEGSGTVLRDSSGKAHDGRIVGAKWTQPGPHSSVPPKDQSDTAVPTSGVELDGIDDYIDLTSDWTYDGGPVTVEMWMTPGIPASDQDGAVFLRGEVPSDQPGGRLNFLYFQPVIKHGGELTGEFHFGRPPDPNVGTARHTLQPGIRTHLAAVFDGKETTIFVDGRAKVRDHLHWQWAAYTRERYLWIGASRPEPDAGPKPANAWTGIIHKARVSSTVRYTEEFVPQPDYEPDPQTEGLYRFDEGTGAVAKDASGKGRHARIVGGTWAVPGQAPASGLINPAPGSYLQFDGVAACVEVPSLRFDGKKPLTLEAWVLADPDGDSDSLKTIMGWSRGASLSRIAKLPWYLFWGYGPQGEVARSEAGRSFDSRRLYHVAGVWDGATLQTFVDGKPGGPQQVAQLFQALRDDAAVMDHFCIGLSIGAGGTATKNRGEAFKGYIDEVRVSQSARYSTEFVPSRRFEPDADTLALFHFDEGSGTEVRDASGHGHLGKVVGAKWFTTSSPLTAQVNGPNYELDFDGKSHVQLPQIDFAGLDALTIEATVTARQPPKKDHKGELTGAFLSDKEIIGLGLLVKERGFIFEVGTKLASGTSGHELLLPGVPWNAGPQRLAGVIDNRNKTAALFVNGRLVERKPLQGDFTGGPMPLMLGADPSASRTPNNFFAGQLDECRLSDVARYSTEYSPPVRLESDSHTLALYHCDEGTGDVLLDSSRHERHGKVFGARWVASAASGNEKGRTAVPGAGEEIDLLKGLKANGEPSGNMKWTREGKSVVGQGIASKPGSEWFGMMYPDEIPGSYDLEIEFNQRGCYPLHIDIPVGDTFCSFDMSPESCGMLEIDDKHGQEFGPPYHHKNVKLKSDVVQKFAVSVRLTGDDAVIKGTLDGELIGEFSGKRKRLSLPHWVNRTKPQVFIGALADLRNMRLVMPRAIVRLWTAESASAPPPPPPAMAPFNAEQARIHQEAWAKFLGTTVETTNAAGMKMILIPPGEYTRGLTEEEAAALEKWSHRMPLQEFRSFEQPAHRVIISKPFRISATEVTVGQFKQFADTGYQTLSERRGGTPLKSFRKPDGENASAEDFPVSMVCWDDAVAFCHWLSQRPGSARTRLPTDAEWEYACRAGTTTHFYFGNDLKQLPDYGWYSVNSERKPHPVGQRRPNPFGLFDMHGGVLEWCSDYFAPFTANTPQTDPTGPATGTEHVTRSGHPFYGGDQTRSSTRKKAPPGELLAGLGFRVVEEIALPAGRSVGSVSLIEGGKSSTTTPTSSQNPVRRPEAAPSSAIAPFDAAKARSHQAAGAKHLGTTVKTTSSVGVKTILIPTEGLTSHGKKAAGETREHEIWRTSRKGSGGPAGERSGDTLSGYVGNDCLHRPQPISGARYSAAWDGMEAKY